MPITIEGRTIGKGQPPFIIAEMSGNHNGDIERARKIVRAAAASGVDCVKFQTYTADTLTMDCDAPGFTITDPDSLWAGRRLHALYQEAHTPWKWHEELFTLARSLGLIAFSTPFDETAVDFLETLSVPFYKVASFEITHLPLIRAIARTGKPMILSTGLASREDIALALETARREGARDLILLKCTSAYPADASDANLATLADMAAHYGVEVGLSDHTPGIGVAIASVAHGACVIEKHFTLSRAQGGVDAAFSLEPGEMKLLKEESVRAALSFGTIAYGGTAREQGSHQFRQSIWPSRAIGEGEPFTRENLKICRPGQSLAPRHLEALLASRATRALRQGDVLTPDDLEAVWPTTKRA
jgi:pseudaminic acid synthase